MKVAVGSSDGKMINQHFGKATQFLIYEVTPAGHTFLEARNNDPFCTPNMAEDGHPESRMERTIRLIDDCQAVLCSRIGNESADLLRGQGIKPLEAPLGIDLALEKLSKAMVQRRI